MYVVAYEDAFLRMKPMKPAKYAWYLRNEALEEADIDSPLHSKVLEVLARRGLSTTKQVESWLHNKTITSPWDMEGMEVASKRILQAIEQHEKIMVYGDYDVDGVCSTTIMVKALRQLFGVVVGYVPNRFEEGYGFHDKWVTWAANEGIRLIITVDVGITANETIQYAKENGIDVIVTDHHYTQDFPDAAYAVLHPSKAPSACSNLCGAGIAWKLACAISGREVTELLDLVAVATLADQVPLIDENRVLVRAGLQQLHERMNVGLLALCTEMKLTGYVNAEDIGFKLAPALNAVGRIDSAMKAFRLLMEENFGKAKVKAEEAVRLNEHRKELTDRVEAQAIEQIEANKHWTLQDTIVVAGPYETWHEGVIGIVAGRLAERYHRPTVCLSVHEGVAKGSGRSVEGFDLYEALYKLSERGLFQKFGGHAMAAGLSMDVKNIPALRDLLHVESTKQKIPQAQYVADAELSLHQLSYSLLNDLEKIGPFGNGNEKPMFWLRDAYVTEMNWLGKENKYFYLKVAHPGTLSYKALVFRHPEWYKRLEERKAKSLHFSIDLLVQLHENIWQDKSTIQMVVIDWQ